MSDEAALLAAIRDNPDEDTPRLVFADWLDEQGGESNAARAEYIRLEVEQYREAAGRSFSRVRDVTRQTKLWAQHGTDWFPEFFGKKNLLRGTKTSIRTRRGFPYYLYSHNPGPFLAAAPKLFDLAPITDVILNDVNGYVLDGLKTAAWATRLRYVQLAGYTTPATPWARLADNEHLANLGELVLCDGTFDPAGAARIAAANPFPRLKRLAFSSMALSDAAVPPLFGGSAFTGLEELSISERGENLTVAAVEAIASAPPLARLKSLTLPYRPRPWLIASLAKAAFWQTLEELEVQRSALGDDGMRDLARSEPPALRTLRLDNNGITGAGFRALVESPVLGTLTELTLWGNAIGDNGVVALANSPRAAGLRKLDLYACHVGLKGITALAESPHLAGLRDLQIGGNEFGVQGAKVLALSPYLTNLTALRVSGLTAASKKYIKTRFGAIASF